MSIVSERRQRVYNPDANRKRVEAENINWESLYESLVEAYMLWDRLGTPAVDESIPLHREITCIDIFGS